MTRRFLLATLVVFAACPSSPKPAQPGKGEDRPTPVEVEGNEWMLTRDPPAGPADPRAGGDDPADPRDPADPPADRRDPPAAAALDPTLAVLLAEHNRVRAAHCAPPLAWSAALAEEAAAWARTLADRGCAFEHSSSAYGENLAAGTASALGPERVVAMWAEEVSAYDFKRARFGMDTGHFTQVVWKTTTALGCGVVACKSLSIWVCNYDPAGNVAGDFAANVAPASCKK